MIVTTRTATVQATIGASQTSDQVTIKVVDDALEYVLIESSLENVCVRIKRSDLATALGELDGLAPIPEPQPAA